MNTRHAKIETRMLIGLAIAAAIVIGIAAILMIDVTGRGGSGLSQAYDLDVAKLAAFDPNLILYREDAPAIATGFARSHALAVDASGLIYVAGDSAIRLLDQTGDLQRVIGLASEPRCLAVLADGTIYVGLRDHVEVFDSKGQRQAAWPGLGERTFLTSIAVSGSDVFLADAGNAVVVHCDTTGKVIERMGLKGSDEGQIAGGSGKRELADGSDHSPSAKPSALPLPPSASRHQASAFLVPSPYFDVAVAPDGLLRVVNPGLCRVETYTFNGDMEGSWGHNSAKIDGFCGCCNPVNIAVLPDGGVVTAEKGLIRVKVYNADGSLRGVVAGPDQLVAGGAAYVFQNAADAQASGFDVAVDSQQRVLVLDTIKNTVRIFARSKVRE
jgi:hypothetical protein